MLSLTLIICFITVATSLFVQNQRELFAKMTFNPYLITQNNEWFRVLTHAFIHSRQDIFHLIFNMYVLYIFGSKVESFIFNGAGMTYPLAIVMYISLYVGGIIFAALPGIPKYKDNVEYNSVGASGAVMAVLFAYILLFPTDKLMLMFLPIPLPAYIFGALYMAYEIYMNKRKQGNVAHDAHIWGAVFGILFTLISFYDVVLANVQMILS